jgi:DNA-binding Xre family transcriptional regulator
MRGKIPMVKIFMHVRLHIREIAEQRGISRTKLSRLADVNYATVNTLWADEVRDVQLVTLGKLARALKVNVTDLYTLVDDENE